MSVGSGEILNQQFKKISIHELEKMSLIDFVEMFKYLSKHLHDQHLSLDRDIYNQIKVCFIREA